LNKNLRWVFRRADVTNNPQNDTNIKNKIKYDKKGLSKTNMKTSIIILLLLTAGMLRAQKKDPDMRSTAEHWLETANEMGFLENRGQMMDMNGNPVPQVLYKTEAPDLNIWITTEGLVIQTLRWRKERIPENELTDLDREEAQIYGKPKTQKYLDWERVDVILKDATIKKENILEENPKPGHKNFFYPHCSDGIYEVKEYEKITIKDVYPGIDWVLYRSKEKGFKYDFVIHPGADYRQIELLYRSKSPVIINASGEIEMRTELGQLQENTPVSFYEGNEIQTRFQQNKQEHISLHGDQGYETSISFLLSTSLPLGGESGGLLVIDPELIWATFYGGNGLDGPVSIDIDNSGNVFVGGYCSNTGFPVQDAGTFFQATNLNPSFQDVFIIKFTNDGNQLWATLYGGSASEQTYDINLDANGNVFLTGWTFSTNFPVQNAGTFFQGTNGGNSDAFILKFNNAGTRLWATYYGGGGADRGYSIATDGNGNVFVAGRAASTNLPVQNAGTFFQGTNAGGLDGYILKFNNAGTRLWATYYGGSGSDTPNYIAIDGSNNVFVTGVTSSTNFPVQNAGTFFQGTNAGGTFDGFILKFNNAGTRLWATYYGGSLRDDPMGIVTDGSGNIFITGYTASTDFPVLTAGTFFQGTNAGGRDAFIVKFNNAGTRLWATYFGGSGNEVLSSSKNLAITSCGDVYMSIETSSTVLPLQASCDAGYFDNTYNGGTYDNFLILFSNTGALQWSTYIGGNGNDFRESLALDANNNLFIAGEWTSVPNSATYPVVDFGGGAYFDGTFNGGLDDGFFLKFCSDPCICGPGCFIPLPIELISFYAVCNEGSVNIEWATASEINNDYFTIERSFDGVDWEIIKTVDGSGYSISTIYYQAKDENPYHGISYYRLKQTDFDGEYKYSNLVSVNCNLQGEHSLIIYPNPTTGIFYLLSNEDEYRIEVLNNLGKIILTAQSSKRLDLSNISVGTYFIRAIFQYNIPVTKKLIIIK